MRLDLLMPCPSRSNLHETLDKLLAGECLTSWLRWFRFASPVSFRLVSFHLDERPGLDTNSDGFVDTWRNSCKVCRWLEHACMLLQSGITSCSLSFKFIHSFITKDIQEFIDWVPRLGTPCSSHLWSNCVFNARFRGFLCCQPDAGASWYEGIGNIPESPSKARVPFSGGVIDKDSLRLSQHSPQFDAVQNR